ncbi:MAG: antibiotic biosynthesis monooxygenase [Oenococcus sp.]|uniref:putative quinol monooxygenase n=1 Tax=Oenococcus sp. TaxID=1979414 RepID=UPI0039EB42DF
MQTTKGNGSQLLQLLLKASKELEPVGNCFCYIVGMNQNEPDAVYVYEVWKDEAAHNDSLKLPAVRNLIEAAGPILDRHQLESFPNLTIYGGKASL